MHQDKARLYQVSIDIILPDEETGTSYHAEQQRAHENVDVAIREVFDAARSQLEDYVRQQRAYLKMQDAKSHSQIA